MRAEGLVRVGGSPRRDCASDAAFVREARFASRGLRLHTAVASSRGLRHVINEDGHSTLDGASPVFVVADGVSSGAMASHASGELVARLQAELSRDVIDADAVRRAILDADREIARSIGCRSDAPGAATVALCAAKDSTLARWLVAWVGDCRVYRVGNADPSAELLTRDDTYRHLDEAAPPGGMPDDPARMIGNGAVDAPNVRDVALRHGEALVLCSDGVHRHADDRDIARLLHMPTTLARRCVRLIELARAHGSHDDATVLAVERPSRSRAPLTRGLTTLLRR